MSKKIHEIDFAKLELRVLAHMREDVENMEDTDSFKRPGDFHSVSVIELRKHLSLEEAKNILEGGVVNAVDFHKKVAAELFAIREEDVTPKHRAFAKSYTFADLYGATDETKSKLFRNARIEARDQFEK